MTFSFLGLWSSYIDLGAAAAVENFAAKEEQRHDYQDDENNKHGDNAGARSATLR